MYLRVAYRWFGSCALGMCKGVLKMQERPDEYDWLTAKSVLSVHGVYIQRVFTDSVHNEYRLCPRTECFYHRALQNVKENFSHQPVDEKYAIFFSIKLIVYHTTRSFEFQYSSANDGCEFYFNNIAQL